jgi:trimeric autotransporter adhesin
VNLSTVNGQQSTVNSSLSSASLLQNVPNPYNHTTSIAYNLPEQFSSAQIIITDVSGKVLKTITVSGKGKGVLNLDASSLASGAYNYSLLIDGKLIDTKKMVLTK